MHSELATLYQPNQQVLTCTAGPPEWIFTKRALNKIANFDVLGLLTEIVMIEKIEASSRAGRAIPTLAPLHNHLPIGVNTY